MDNNERNLALKNEVEVVREYIQRGTNYIKNLEVQENLGYDTRRERFDVTNHINSLKDKEAKLEDKLKKNGVSYYNFF